MANYLKKYIDQVADVPGQLQRFFKLLGDLEDRVVALQADVDAKCKDHIAKAHSSSKLGRSSPSAKRQKTDASTSALGQEIDVSMQKILSLAEEKVRDNSNNTACSHAYTCHFAACWSVPLLAKFLRPMCCLNSVLAVTCAPVLCCADKDCCSGV